MRRLRQFARRGDAKNRQRGDRYRHEDVSGMVGDAGRLVAERQERRYRAFTAEPAAEEFGGQQELGEEASEGEGSAGRRFCDAQALQANATGCVQDKPELLKEDWHSSFSCHIT